MRAYQHRIVSTFYLESEALGVYDAVLSFSKEVRCIWQRPFSAVTILYFCIRYGAILCMLNYTLEATNVALTIPVSLPSF